MHERSIYEAFTQQVALSPNAVAVIDEHRSITYAELDRLAESIAAELPHKSDFIGIVMDHGAEMIASMLAVLRVGAAYVPAEPTFPIERIQFMLTEADVDAVITQRVYDGLFRYARRVFIEPGRAIPTDADDKPVKNAAPSSVDLAYVLYTSGTTGIPKGVCVENRNVTAYVSSFIHEFGIGPGDVMLQYSVCSFDIFVEEVFATLLSGATLAIPPVNVRRSTELLAGYIDEKGVTIVDGFPYLIADLNRLPKVPAKVRLYVSGGDVLRAAYCDRLLENSIVYNTYGPSETTCCATYYRANDGTTLEDGTYPIGKAVRCARVSILDKELNPVPEGTVGEICIAGGGVSRGYLGKRPEQTNFTTLADGTRIYRSGDLGYVLPDGNIAFIGRRDDQVMIDGRRVECAEVENVLIADPEIRYAVVRAYRDENQLSYMVAYIVPAREDFKLSKLRDRLARRLTDFMIPEFFVQMNEIPLTENGKPDISALPIVLKGNGSDSST